MGLSGAPFFMPFYEGNIMEIRKYCLPLSLDMKQILSIMAVVALLCGCQTHKAVYTPDPSAVYSQEYSPHVLIIMYDSAVGSKPLLEAAQKMKCEVIYQYNIIKGVALRVPDKVKIEEAIKQFEQVKGVLSVERDRIMHLDQQSSVQ